nr:MAG TPA: hypothetical protein [Caudoviricetes sp.]
MTAFLILDGQLIHRYTESCLERLRIGYVYFWNVMRLVCGC